MKTLITFKEKSVKVTEDGIFVERRYSLPALQLAPSNPPYKLRMAINALWEIEAEFPMDVIKTIELEK